MKRIAIIPAGGSGKRFGGELPKQFRKINGKEIIEYTVDVFLHCDFVDEIIIAVNEKFLQHTNEIFSEARKTKPIKIVEGGKERQDSVFAALSFIENPQEDDFVIVHDAARPFLKISTVKQSIKIAEVKRNAVVAIASRDSLAKVEDYQILDHVERSKIYYLQTPQIFRYSVLKKAMDNAYAVNFIGTDESTIVKKFTDEKIFIAEGDFTNFKITTPEDFALAEKILSNI